MDLYPLKFSPFFQYRLWGGRRLESLFSKQFPKEIPIGEVWLLSDRDDCQSVVAEGPLKGRSIRELIGESKEELLGKAADHFSKFPLLLKFLDAREQLSIQVHPSDDHKELLPIGEKGKTEAWVIMDQGRESKIYAGIKPGATPSELREALQKHLLPDLLESFIPKKGDAIFIPAGTLHALKGAVVFEVQQNSDVTFRLFDWDRVDQKTGKMRTLQIEEALSCIDFGQGRVIPKVPKIEEEGREILVESIFFNMWRISKRDDFAVGAADEARLLVCLSGSGKIIYGSKSIAIEQGDLILMPASLGASLCHPDDAVTLLEISLPQAA